MATHGLRQPLPSPISRRPPPFGRMEAPPRRPRCSRSQSWQLPTPGRSPPPEPGLAGSCQDRPQPGRPDGGAHTCPQPSLKFPLGSRRSSWEKLRFGGSQGPPGPPHPMRFRGSFQTHFGGWTSAGSPHPLFSAVRVVKGGLLGLEPWLGVGKGSWQGSGQEAWLERDRAPPGAPSCLPRPTPQPPIHTRDCPRSSEGPWGPEGLPRRPSLRPPSHPGMHRGGS